jgi:hypothetical protein
LLKASGLSLRGGGALDMPVGESEFPDSAKIFVSCVEFSVENAF